MLQLYRLYVVHTENSKANKKKILAERDRSRKRNDLNEMNQFNDIYIISSGKFDKKKKHKRYRIILMCHYLRSINLVFILKK